MGQKFECPECEYQFTQKGNLATHTKSVHMGQKFQCPECEYQATWKGSLVRHQKSLHMFCQVAYMTSLIFTYWALELWLI